MEKKKGSGEKRKPFQWEAWGVRFSAILTALMGMINLTSAVQPALQSRLAVIETVFPLEVRHGSRIISALAGFALLLVARSLMRRKRLAWALTILLLAVTIFSHLVKGLDLEEASLGFGLLALLLLLHRSFFASTDRPSIRQGLTVLVAAFTFTLVYGTIGFYLLDKHFETTFRLADAIRQTVVMFTMYYNPGLEPITGFGRYFADSIYLIGLCTIGFALLMLVRPVLVRLPASAEEWGQAEKIVQQYGRTSLARATLFEDKSYFFGPAATVTAFAVRQNGAMVLGDPIGPPEEAEEAIHLFRQICARNDWTPSYVSTLPDYLEAYRSAGFDTVCIGYEAIVHLDSFTLEGSGNKGIRNTLSRMEREGYKAVVHMPPLEDELLYTLNEISDAWLTMRHGEEMRFSDGWFNDNYIRNGPVMVVHAPDGKPTAFTNLVHEYQKNEMTIDLMRRYREVEQGTMEFLFARMLQWAREKGYGTFSLGLSAVVGVGEKPEDPRVEQALHTLSEYGSRFFNFKGLHAFKEKFHPQWEPRYLVYPGAASLPLVLATLMRVHSGNNLLWNFLRR